MAEVKVRTLENFKKVVISLDKALKLQQLPEMANRDAVLLRFELAAELMPKILNDNAVNQNGKCGLSNQS